MTIEKKLMFCVTGMLAVVLALAGAGWYSTQKLGGQLSFTTRTVGVRSILGGELNARITAQREEMRGVILYAMAHDRKSVEQHREAFGEQARTAKATVQAIRPLLTTARGLELVQSIDDDLDRYARAFEQVSSLIAAGKLMPAVALNRDTAAPVGARMGEAGKELIEFQKT